MRLFYLPVFIFWTVGFLNAQTSTPTIAAPSVSDGPLGALDWGTNPSTGQSWTAADLRQKLTAPVGDRVQKAVQDLLSRAAEDESRQTMIMAIPEIHLEGTLASKPEYKESESALKTLDTLEAWALAARIETGSDGAAYAQAARDGILNWVMTYDSPTGNPINEGRLIPLLKAIDWYRPLFQTDEWTQVQAWLRKLIAASDQFKADYANDERGTNNFETWRLALRAIAAQVLGDPAEVAATGKMMHDHIRQNIWDDGSTFDFHRRGALHYHVYDLEAYTQALIYVPSVYQLEDRARLEKAFEFLKPYDTGEKEHIEFSDPDPSLGKPIQFDIQRRDAGQKDFLNQPWDPKAARNLLRLGRAALPEIRDWTTGLLDENYDPVIKLTVALHGD